MIFLTITLRGELISQYLGMFRNRSIFAFDNQENAYYSSRFKSPAGIDRDAMRFQGLGAILLWLAHFASISHDKPRHCAAVTKPPT